MKLVHNDIELIERLQKGDVEAFDQIYEKYSGKLYAFGLKYLKSTAEAEELVQSVFLKLWENYRSLKKELSLKLYLFTIAYNDICKFFRKRNCQQRFITNFLYENSQSSSKIEDSIDYKSVLDQLNKIINKLPERQKTIFLKSRQEGKSSKEIAGELSLSSGTIDNYISESLKFIRSRMQSRNLLILLPFLLFFL